MKNLKILFVFSFLVALTGCWDQDVEDGNGEPIGVFVPITSTVGANFVKGPVTGATCELFEVTEAGAQGSSIATGMTTAGVVDFGDDVEYFGTALVQCFGGSYTDEATGATMAAPEMRAVVNIERDAEFSVTPLTEMAAQLAETAGDLNAAVATHNDAVADSFGFGGDITMVVPTDLMSVAATNNYEGQYATALALISQLHATDGGSLSDLIDGLSLDLVDGEFSTESMASMGQAVTDLESSEVSAALDVDALSTIVDRAGIPVVEEEQFGVAEISEDDDIGMPGNDIESVSIEIVDTNLVVTQTHKGAKDTWHEIRVYLTVDDSDTTDMPLANGAASLMGLNAEYGYVFTFNDGPDPLEWYIARNEVSGGAWSAVAETMAAVSGGDTDVTTMMIPLSEIGDPTDIAEIQMMFVGTGAGWGTDQLPNDGMYQHVWPAVAELMEDDDIDMPGNDIESVSAEVVGTDLVVTQTHKGAKDTWHEIRAYFTVDDSDTTMDPIASGAASLMGLNAEYGYVFTFNDGPDPLEWYTAKKEVSNGAWTDVAETSAGASGGDTDVTIMTIPLSEIGGPADISEIQMMFVGTGAGWGTDQIPNDGMYQYVVPAVATEFADAADEGVDPAGNDIASVSIVNDATHITITQTHVAAKSTWHEIRVYLNLDSSDTITTPLASGAASLTGLNAEYGYVFTFNDGPDPLEWYIARNEVSAGAWSAVAETAAGVSGGDTDVTTMMIPLSEVGNPAAGDTVQLMFVGTGAGWGTDQAPNDTMLDYVIQ